jgi:hypothetical protein
VSVRAALKELLDKRAYAEAGRVERRWGQLLREPPEVRAFAEAGLSEKCLAALSDVANVRGGVVTRANAYFLLRELPLEEVPERFHVTRADLRRLAVLEDGLKTLHRIERAYIRPILKGPDSLVAPGRTAETMERLLHVGAASKEQLRTAHASGVLDYLKRGESVPYDVSEDRLKGGIPAQRANVRNRKPYWYSLFVPDQVARIVVPEHFDTRFVATLQSAKNPAVVLDKLFTVTPHNAHAEPLLWALNSLFTWYQLELRGRTQLGEGVLEVKAADWKGVLVLEPRTLKPKQLATLRRLFEPLEDVPVGTVGDELARDERVAFDVAYLEACGVAAPDEFRLLLEREFRAAMAERRDRPASVADAKTTRRTIRRLTTDVDAHAARIAARLEPFPDPRAFFEATARSARYIPITGPVEGSLRIGDDLFSQGDVFAGDRKVASTGSPLAAQFVRAALLHDPGLSSVAVPKDLHQLAGVMAAWSKTAAEWHAAFRTHAEKALKAVTDERTRGAIEARARALLHAE